MANFTHDLDDILKGIPSSQIPFIVSTSINKTLFGLKKNETEVMRNSLLNPTTFTLKSIVFNKASKQTLEGTLNIQPKQEKYLTFTIQGGKRTPDNKAIAVPIDKKLLNTSKDIPRSKITTMLKNKKKYFNSKETESKMLPGIYERVITKTKSKVAKTVKGKKVNRTITKKTTTLKLLLAWKQQTTYDKPTFKFHETSINYIKENLNVHVKQSIDKALATMK